MTSRMLMVCFVLLPTHTHREAAEVMSTWVCPLCDPSTQHLIRLSAPPAPPSLLTAAATAQTPKAQTPKTSGAKTASLSGKSKAKAATAAVATAAETKLSKKGKGKKEEEKGKKKAAATANGKKQKKKSKSESKASKKKKKDEKPKGYVLLARCCRYCSLRYKFNS